MVNFGDNGFGNTSSRRSSYQFKKFKNMKFEPKNIFSHGIKAKAILLVLAVAVLLWMATGFYRVNPGQRGVELVFGKANKTTTGPGLHYNFPYPIGDTFVPDVQKLRRVDIGYRSQSSFWDRNVEINNTQDVPKESSMLTSDENIVDIDFTVFWHIGSVENFLFNLRNPEKTIKIAAESAIRQIVGETSFDKTVTVGRAEIESKTLDVLQSILDSYGSGVTIAQVALQKSDPPKEVIDAFNDVQRARQDKDRLQNEAEAYANSVIPVARGKAASIVQQAEGYKVKVVEESKGEAARFLKVYESYKQSPLVVRKRIYLDALAQLYNKVDKIMIDPKTSSVLPYIKLPGIDKHVPNKEK